MTMDQLIALRTAWNDKRAHWESITNTGTPDDVVAQVKLDLAKEHVWSAMAVAERAYKDALAEMAAQP